MAELGAPGTQADLDIAQAMAGGELGERHAEELVEAPARLDLAIAAAALGARGEATKRREFHQLREDASARMHDPSHKHQPLDPDILPPRVASCNRRRSIPAVSV